MSKPQQSSVPPSSVQPGSTPPQASTTAPSSAPQASPLSPQQHKQTQSQTSGAPNLAKLSEIMPKNGINPSERGQLAEIFSQPKVCYY